MGLKRKILSNTVYSALDSMAVAVVGYLFWMSMGKMLSPDYYGTLTTVIVLYGFFAFVLTLNAPEVFGKFIPQYLSKNNEQKARATISAYFLLALLVIFSVSSFIYFYSEKIAVTFYSDVKMADGLKLLSVLTIFGSLSVFFRAILYGFQRMKEIFLANAFGGIVKLGASVGLVWFGFLLGGVIGVILGFIASVAVQACLIFSRGFRFDFHFGAADKSVFLYGFSSVVTSILIFLVQHTGTVMLGVMMNLYSVGLFGIGILFGSVLTLPFAIALTAVLPPISVLFSDGEKEKLERLVKAVMKYVLIFSIPPLLTILLIPDIFIKFAYTGEYLAASLASGVYATGMVMLALSIFLLQLVFISGHPNVRTIILALAALVNVILTAALIPTYGINGASLAFLGISAFLVASAYFLVKKYVKISLKVEYEKLALPLSIFLIFILAIRWLDIGTTYKAVFAAASYLAFFAGLVLVKFFDMEDREMIGLMVQRFRRKRSIQ